MARQVFSYRDTPSVVVLGQMDNTIDHTFESANRVYDKNGLCLAIPTCAGGGIQPKVIEENMSERQNRIKAKKLPNGNIRFYQDDERKSAVSELQVQSCENMVQTITTANVPKIYEEATEEKRIQKVGQTSNEGSQPMIVDVKDCKVIGGLGEKKSNNGTQYFQQDRVYQGDISPALPAQLPGGSYKYIVASRGRGVNNEQRLEPNKNGITNSLTTVQKDNLVLKEPCYRIRKLTPRECWRLMGYTDDDFDKAAKVNSHTQLYKQAGNAIIRQVLMAIFLQLNIQGKKNWNDRTDKEVRSLWND